MSFQGITHFEAVAFLQNATGPIHFQLMRKVAPVKVGEEATNSANTSN